MSSAPNRLIRDPQLEDLGSLQPTLVLDRLVRMGLLGYEPSELQARSLVTNVIRHADQALVCYGRAREALLRHAANRSFLELFRAVDDFESCILALHRGAQCLERLRRLGYQLSDGRNLIAKPAAGSLLDQTSLKQIGSVRDAIMHLDERILSMADGEDRPIALFPTDDHLELEGHTLSYLDLARWLKELRTFADMLNDIGPGGAAPHPRASKTPTC